MAARQPIARQPEHVVAWILLAAAFAVALFGSLRIAGLLLIVSLGAYVIAGQRANRGEGPDPDASEPPPR